MMIPVNEEPLEAEALLVPAGDVCSASPGTGVRDVVEMSDGTLRSVCGLRVRPDLMEARQKEPLILRAVYESVAHVTHRRLDDGEGDPSAVITNLRGRLEELTETLIPQRPGRPLHILHLETHVTHCVHRVVCMGSVQTFQVPLVYGCDRTPTT